MAVRLGLRDRACTDMACTWNQVTWNGVEPGPLKNITFYSEEAKSKLSKGLIRRAPPKLPTNSQQEAFLLNLLRCKSEMPVALSLFASTSVNFITKAPPPVTKKLPHNLADWRSHPPSDPLLEICTVTPQQIAYLDEMTLTQAGSLIWHEMRVGRITASQVYTVLHTNQKKPAPSLLNSLTTSEPRPLNTEAVLWGRKHEEVAALEYADFMSDHSDFELSKSGLKLHPDEPFLGATPDGMVTCSCCGDGVLEVKCPHKYRNSTISDMVEASDSCLDKDLNLKPGHRYYDQVQLQLYVTNRKYADFLVWLTEESHVCRVSPDQKWITSVPPILKAFWLTNVVPLLLAQPEEVTEPDAPATYHCKCGEEDEGGMVGCDNEACTYQWFHWKCVGLSKPPPSKKVWYCPDCRPRKKRKL